VSDTNVRKDRALKINLSKLTFSSIVASSFQNGVPRHTCREMASAIVSEATDSSVCYTDQIHSNALTLHFRDMMYSPKTGEPLFPNDYTFQNDSFSFTTYPGEGRLYRPYVPSLTLAFVLLYTLW
jgi:hypothetical protein